MGQYEINTPNPYSIMQANALYAYCTENPVNNIDLNGLWTFGISLGINANFIFGISFSIGIYIDDNFNIDFQYSYSVTGVDDTVSVGIMDVGIGVTAQITNADTTEGLLGPTTAMGASGGGGLSVGGDVITFDDPTSSDASIDGAQLTVGVGVGVDVHINKTNTKSLIG